MKYKNKEKLKEQAIQLYMKGKTYMEISEVLGCSRNYVSELIRDDERIKQLHNQKILKVYKNPNKGKKNLTIGIDLLSKIGISTEYSSTDYVKVSLDKESQQLIIRKHEI